MPQRPMLIPFQWIGLFATLTVFAVMFAIGLMLGREQVAAALERRVVLAAVVFAVVVPVPVVAVLALKAFALKGPVAVGIIWRWLYDERGGFINYVLRSAGIVDQPVKFLQSFDWALACVIAAEFWQVLGFYMIILLTGLQSIPQHLYEAARVDGVPPGARFLRITLPLLRPSIFLCIVIGILNSFTSFDLIYVMTNGGPGHATELLITYIYKAGFGQTRFDYAAALTVVQFLLLVVLTVIANRLSGGNAGSLER